MIMNKPLAKGNIVTFRVNSGEEILGRFSHEDEKTLTMSKIVVVGMRMAPNNQATIAFIPFLGSIDDSGDVTFFKTSLVTVPQKPRNDVEQGYVQATSNIVLPSAATSSLLKA